MKIMLMNIAFISGFLFLTSNTCIATSHNEVKNKQIVLKNPSSKEIKDVVKVKSSPKGQYRCTHSGLVCSCTGSKDCFKLSAEKNCQNVTCNTAGCVADDCDPRKSVNDKNRLKQK